MNAMAAERTSFIRRDCPFVPTKDCAECDAHRRCFLDSLSPESVRLFRAERRMRLYKAGQPVFTAGDDPRGIHILCVGDARMVKSDAGGRELTLAHLSCGDFMGEAWYVAGKPYGATVETVRDSVVCFVPRDLVERFRKTEPAFELMLLRWVSRSVSRSMDRVFTFAFRSAEARLAGFIMDPREVPRNGIPAKGPARGGLPASAGPLDCRGREPRSRREIADILGLSPETVIRTLSAFQRRGLVRLSGRSIKIRDRAGLEAVAQER
ncbi:MAG: Crp/Fnr family transcriptional regulator [Elusimicrobia bacterium]|nr:Crp/Fnr family transcriptional regulator [Elusimicrobiota bacterium]